MQAISRRRREDDQRLRAAEEAVQPRAAGKTRPEIREMLSTELRAWSRPLPSSGSLDVTVDHIARFAEQTAAGRTGAARAFAVLAGDLKIVSRIIRAGLKNDVSDPSGRDPYFVSPDSPAALPGNPAVPAAAPSFGPQALTALA